MIQWLAIVHYQNKGEVEVVGKLLDRVKIVLIGEVKQVAIVTKRVQHFDIARGFVEEVLGKPQSFHNDILTFSDGMTVQFHVASGWRTRDIDFASQRPVIGFDGVSVFFGPAECDEFRGVIK